MIYLLPLLAVCVLLAAISQHYTTSCARAGVPYQMRRDTAFVILVVILVLFAGLRTSYNDTYNYIRGFGRASTITGFLSNPENLNPFTNPLFGLYSSILKTFTNDAQVLIFTTAAFTQICILRFLKRYSEEFTFSVFLYITLGTFVFTLAAIKQVVAMAIMTLAFPCLQRRQWGRYYLFVLIATLFHTYSLAFALLPFFRNRPWRPFTFVFLIGMAFILLNFEETLTTFMDQANDLGKNVAAYEIFDDATINLFRLAVYAIPPLLSLVLRRWALNGSRETDHVMIHMSIISFAFMCLGTQAGANMFGRMGNYFELGTLCCLPQILKKSFDDDSYRLVTVIACACFMGFFVYANAIKLDFASNYRAISLLQLLLP